MDLRFHTLDVFTNATFGGNGLGVFPGAAHLPATLMQRIAGEMGLSETVFLGPPESDGDARVRIFTPAVELPFAGHPTVGTAIFLASRADIVPEEGSAQFVLEENVGPVPVEVRFEGGRPVFARFTTAMIPTHEPSPWSRADLAAMVGLAADELDAELPVEIVSAGVPYHIIPVRTLDSMKRSVLDLGTWKRMLGDSAAHHVCLVSREAEGADVDFHVRMYAPGSGVPEDPATGSAAASLGGYLSVVDGRADGTLSWTLEQGIELGRPSLIYVEADRAGGRTTAVRVGGSAVFVSSGTMTVPDVWPQ